MCCVCCFWLIDYELFISLTYKTIFSLRFVCVRVCFCTSTCVCVSVNMGRLALTPPCATAKAFVQEPGGPVSPLSGFQCHYATPHHPLPSWWPRKWSDSRGKSSGLIRRLEGSLGSLTQAWAKNTSQLSSVLISDWLLGGKFWSHLQYMLSLMTWRP